METLALRPGSTARNIALPRKNATPRFQEAMLAFSVWYATQGLGRIQSMPAFDAKSFETAIKDAAG